MPSVLLDRLVARGVDLARLLRLAGVLPSRFQSSKAMLTTREFFAFWHALGEVAKARDIGLQLGSEALPHQLDVASLAALHSANLGEALKTLARYKRLCMRGTLEIDFVDDEVRIRKHWGGADEELPPMLVEAAFASLLALARRGTGNPVAPLRLELARRRADETMLVRHFGCEVLYDAPFDVFLLDKAALGLPFLTQNADLCAVMLPGLEAALRESLMSRTAADDLRTVLRRCMSGQRPSMEKAAGDMRMSPRTLQRRLEELGTSYQKLLDEVRRDTARRLLVYTDVDAAEIAFLLGFDELNSFTRAFHAWEGVTPTRWRRSERKQLRALATPSSA